MENKKYHFSNLRNCFIYPQSACARNKKNCLANKRRILKKNIFLRRKISFYKICRTHDSKKNIIDNGIYIDEKRVNIKWSVKKTAGTWIEMKIFSFPIFDICETKLREKEKETLKR